MIIERYVEEMKDNIKKAIDISMISIDIVLLIYTIIMFIAKEKIASLIYPINAAFFMLLTFATIWLLGYQKNKKNRAKIKITNTILIFLTLYLITIYLAGNATSFIKRDLSIPNIIYLTIYFISAEIFRYTFQLKCNKTNFHQYLLAGNFVLLDILVLSSFSPINTLPIANLLTILLMSVMKNAILCYTTAKFGYNPCLIYSFIMTVVPLIMPIYPNLGNYLTLVLNIICSAIIFYNISKPIRRSDEESINKYQKSIGFYLERALLVIVVIVILLVSGIFRFSLTAIASDSMYPALKKGDAVIMEKVDEKNRDSLKKGDIVAFEENGSIVTHRILTIEMEDGEERIITKGDNNYTKDVTKKTKDDIIGIVKLRIPLLGYPSVEISEIKKNK